MLGSPDVECNVVYLLAKHLVTAALHQLKKTPLSFEKEIISPSTICRSRPPYIDLRQSYGLAVSLCFSSVLLENH